MAYRFEPCNGNDKYRLVREGWIRRTRPLDVYLARNTFGQYELQVFENRREVTSKFLSQFTAVKILSILKDKGVKKTDLQNARFPKGAEERAMNNLATIVSALSIAEAVSKEK